MKMKKTVSTLLAIIMLTSVFCVFAYAKTDKIEYDASGCKVCKDPSDMFNFVLADGHEAAPVRVVRATLKQGGKSMRIYLIGLVGVEMNHKQVNVFKNTLPSAVSKENDYTKYVKEILDENVPKGSKLVFCGHSLGGMVAQQLCADKWVKDNYNVISTLTAGSPYIIEKNREGDLVRLADKFDAVPYLSAATFVKLFTQLRDRFVEDGGYFFDPSGAHNLSYRESEIWGGYDALGNPDGDATITFYYVNLMKFGRIPND